MILQALMMLALAKPDTAFHRGATAVRDSVPTDSVHSSRPPPSAGRCSFRVREVPTSQALALFARSQGLSVSGAEALPGTVTIDLVDVPVEKVVEAILGPHGLSWEAKGGQVKVLGGAGTRIFRIDYLRLKRGGQGSSQASVSTTGSGEAGRVSLSTSDELMFWDELEGQIKQILTGSGQLVANRTAGILMVRDAPARLDEVDAFLSAVLGSATRQVELTARIYEVQLSDDNYLGVDWDRVEGVVGKIGNRTFSGGGATNLVQTGADWKAATIAADLSVDGYDLKATISALSEQGNVRAISQPRVVTLNNQPAMIKVGTDMPYFTTTVSQGLASGVQNTQEDVHVVTVGVVLSVTPEISTDGIVQLGIEPMISSLTGTATSRNGSTAPIIDIKQSSSMVRIRDRETVRLSGLIQEGETSTDRKVPLLGDIPVVGALFRWTYKREYRKELVIFITPRIL